MANSTDPDQMPHLVWVYIVGKGLSVPILRVIMVMFHTPQPVTQNDCTDQYIMGYVKQNGAFEYSQNAQIEIQLTRYLDLAYLEVKIWSLPIHENLKTDGKYCRKEEKLLLRSNFSSFPQYFQYISNFKSPITYQFVKCG